MARNAKQIWLWALQNDFHLSGAIWFMNVQL